MSLSFCLYPFAFFMSQLTNTVLMIKPYKFGFNPDAAETNSFMQSDGALSLAEREDIAARAAREFADFTALLRSHNLHVVEIEDTPSPHTPDSIFPNNWISTHADGRVVLYPMEPPNRRLERREEVITAVQRAGGQWKREDLSGFEADEIFLEGTGSLVLDRANQIAYANRSTRMHSQALKRFCEVMNFIPIEFSSLRTGGGGQIYHTNVMMAVGEQTSVVCAEVIRNPGERAMVLDALKARQKVVIEISEAQMDEFAGNMLQLRNDEGQRFWIMSSRAHSALLPEQIASLQHDSVILHTDLDVIERFGGGSARCMLAEIFATMPAT
ncbi:MAG: amidinotransferase [Candidatus Kapaibacterium sp.]|nr:MAG: amidinotransferase [Candidatus Kapabacteria bacterium]